jgi:hypothetical protein
VLLVAIGWLYVVGMVAIVEANSRSGSVLGALLTFALYGLLPLALLGYLFFSPARRRARRAAEQLAASAGLDPDEGGHAAGEAVAPVREEP